MTAAPELVATVPPLQPLPRLPACLTRRADGEIVVTGTRVRMADVLAVADGGVGLDDLVAAFPRVRPDRLAGVVAFRARHLEAVDAYLRGRRGGGPQATPDVSSATSPPPAPPHPDPAG
jgi:uncharacterized protein (DUF433 family)